MFAPPVRATKPEAASRAISTRARKAPQQISSRPGARTPDRASRARAPLPLIQPKLVIGEVNDPLEHEADRMAKAVLAGSPASAHTHAPGLLQRACAACEAEEQETVRREIGSGTARQSGPEGHASGPAAAAAAVASGGAPLAADLRSYFEPRFGHDFAQVRLHDHAAAGAAARSIDARAFTLGADIAFAPGEYAPGTTEGRRLLAHELAHVVQQAGTPAASRLMRQPYPGCDRRTTGVDDAETRIDDARVEAVFMAGVASEASARLDSWTIRLADRHFHCPSSSEIGSLRTTFATIRTNIMALDPRCLRKSDPKCRDALAWVSSDGMLEICPIAFAAETASETLSGTFIWGGAINAGKDKGCKWGSPCYDDFTVPASDMMKHADAFEEFALELAGHVHGYPETIPCRPRNTHMSVLVPPDAVRNPALIRPVSGFDPSPPPGSRVVPVWEDSDGQRFIYSDTLPGARAYLPKEPKRFYLPSHLRWGR